MGDERLNTYNRVLRVGLLTFGMLAVVSGATNATAQTVTPEETVRSVRTMLERLPYYGVFDFIAFRVDRGAVYLAGYSFEGRLKMDAEAATKRASGVDEVANKIEVLPASPNDDRIRWETFYRIYTDDFLSRYAPRGEFGVLQDLRDEGHFPGMQPVGPYDPHHRQEWPNDAARNRRRRSGSADCRSACARGDRSVRGGERSDCGTPRKERSMNLLNPHIHARLYVFLALASASLIALAALFWSGATLAARGEARPGTPGVPYPNMPAIAPIGVSVDKYLDLPDSAKGPTIDPAKGYRTQKLGDGLYMVTDGGYQSMFMTYEDGVVVIDAPPSYAAHIQEAIAEVTDKPITYVVYSHLHTDHIAGVKALGGHPVLIAQAETNRLLARDNDPNRPLATVTFDDKYRLSVGSQVLELSYHGNAHAPGNIFIYAPKQRTLMVVDIIFPGWMPWRRFAVSQDIPAYFEQVKEISKWDFDTLVGGHVARTGTHADVTMQLAFIEDLKAAAETALKTTIPGQGLNPADRGNTWAVFDNYIDRVALACVNQLTPKWSTKLAAYDVYIWDQCFAMEQSLRID